MYVFVSYSKDKDARDREGHRKRGRINVSEYVYTYTYTTDIIYIYIIIVPVSMPGNWASKQASKLSSVVVEFVRKDRRVLLGCPFLPFVPFSSRPLSFTSIVDDSRDDLIRGQYRHRFRRSFLSFFAYSHSLILSQFFLFLRFEFFLFFFFFFFFCCHYWSRGWEAWENSGTPYVWPTWRDCFCSFHSFDAGDLIRIIRIGEINL